MRRFVLGWKVLGHEQKLQARIVNYADDFVICCRGTADEAMAAMRNMIDRLKLTLNETKTHICHIYRRIVRLPGVHPGPLLLAEDRTSLSRDASAKPKVLRLCRRISEMTSCRWELLDHDEMVGRLNRVLHGWANYFSRGSVSRAYRAVDRHAQGAAESVVVSQAQAVRKGNHTFPLTVCVRQTGARRAPSATTQPSVCESVIPCPRAGCGRTARPVRRAGCGNGAGFG